MNRLALVLTAAATALVAPPTRADDAPPSAPSPSATPTAVVGDVTPAVEHATVNDGVAAPPTAAGNSGLSVTFKPELEIIAQYTYHSISDNTENSQ